MKLRNFAFSNIIRKDPCTALTARGVISSTKGANVQEDNRKKELSRIRNERYRKAHPDRVKKSQEKFKEKNPERVREIKTKWRLANPEKQKEAVKRSTQKNPEIGIRRNNRRRARRLGNGFSQYTEKDIITLYGTNCHICNQEIDFLAPRSTKKEGWERSFHIDHLIPIVKGGADTLENVRPSHGICNIKKGSR